jgi:hypothetical protein
MLIILRKRIYGVLKQDQIAKEAVGKLICRNSIFFQEPDRIKAIGRSFFQNSVRFIQQKTNYLNHNSVTDHFLYQLFNYQLIEEA